VAGVAVPGDQGRGLNQAIVAGSSGDIIETYTKLHPFTPGGESEHYQAGKQIVTFKWHEFTVAPFVCYDLRFPEIFREATMRGAEMFLVIANWPIARFEHWITLLRARAIENQAYVLGVNRCGADPQVRYPGRTMLVDPTGVVRADAGDREGLLVADISIDLVKQVREQLPFLRDARNDVRSL
jgi:predicted amidohydrolase